MGKSAIGFDFGTESVRVLILDVTDGRVRGMASQPYPHGVIDRVLPTSDQSLPADYALQTPADWFEASSAACRQAMAVGGVAADDVVGIGVDFTSCTMLPCRRDGVPLCMLEPFRDVPMAWPKLWKHHGAKAETDRINAIARERREPWLARYGHSIGIEWFWPKVLETLNVAPAVYAAADVWIEAGDWFVWKLISGHWCDPRTLVRSTCQAGYKACWNAETGYPSPEFFAAVHPGLRDVVADKMPGTLQSPGTSAGGLAQAMADLFGLNAGTPVSTAIIDAHAGVPGAGVADADTFVLVMGTSSCHMLNSHREALAPGIAGVVADGILPGFFGYETGQASVGDAFAWVARTLQIDHGTLNRLAAELPPGSGGVLALDWLNGCRTPLMDGRLSGAFVGMTLTTRPEQLYRAMLEATALGVRWIRDTLTGADVAVNRVVASGGLPAKSPLLMQIYADVLNLPIDQAVGEEPVARGAAMLGAAAAGPAATGHADIRAVVAAMSDKGAAKRFVPSQGAAAQYDKLYALYRGLAEPSGVLADTMRRLRTIDAPAESL